jgi:YD repeat-containing protein
MRSSRPVCFLPLVLLCFAPVASQAQMRRSSSVEPPLRVHDQNQSFENAAAEVFLPPSENGIREVIANKYRKRYQEWKTEFLSTEIGRAQWDAYAHNTQFVLTIVISDENSHGGGTSQYKWDDSGRLIAATVVLGSKIYEGYPNPIYYPVMSALAPGNSSYDFSGSILAATKIAHEFGHLNRMAKTRGSVYQLQSQLVPVYNSILLSNGRNTRDPRLLELSQKMGGTPVEIWEDREYWGEVNAMLFLRDRLETRGSQCSIFNKIREFVKLYARPYEQRFAEVAESGPPAFVCSWQ